MSISRVIESYIEIYKKIYKKIDRRYIREKRDRYSPPLHIYRELHTSIIEALSRELREYLYYYCI